MTKLDDAYELASKDRKAQPLFYDLFLNSLFFIPVIEDENNKDDEAAIPLLVEANDLQYLMIFDTVKRLQDWADDKVKYVALPGHSVTEMSLPDIYWALNYGTEHQKMFEPDEIEWLKAIVRQTKEDAGSAAGEAEKSDQE